ncbi:uncharacterized protein [Procambarus clarkii]|uniref:uncharacterized protein isoform X2 n=1 Tax=Procambarus clarkii TaxID=6728 RepID=UPI0037423A15
MTAKLPYVAIFVLVLLFVVSAMGGSADRYRYFASATNPGVCLSFKYNNNLTDCCNERFYVTKTNRSTGVFHTKDLNKLLCYDVKKGKFKLVKRKTLRVSQCRHMRSRRRHRRGVKSNFIRSPVCPFNNTDLKILHKPRDALRCVLHETLGGSGYTYISVEENAKYLAVRGRRVQKHLKKKGVRREPKEKNRQFMVMSEGNMAKISNKPCKS